jgi:hypothetical protein
MAYQITYTRLALNQLKALPRAVARRVQAEIARSLTHQPTQVSQARIKRFAGRSPRSIGSAVIRIVCFTMWTRRRGAWRWWRWGRNLASMKAWG